MKKIRIQRSTGVIVLVLFFVASGLLWNNGTRTEAKELASIDAVVIRSADVGAGTSGKKDGAILLTGSKEIAEHTELFLRNPRALHACGYTYQIEFWSKTDLYDVIEYNIECGEEFARDTDAIASLMDAYDKKFVAEEVDTIHCIEIPVSRDPEALIHDLKRDGLHVFPIHGMNARYPYLELVFTLQGEDDHEELEKQAHADVQLFLDSWPARLPQPIERTKSDFSSVASLGRQATIEVKAFARFQLEANLDAIAAALETDTLKITATKHKPEYYFMFFISPEENKDSIAKLMVKYSDISVL